MIDTLPEVEVNAPPDSVRLLGVGGLFSVRVLVALARMPPLTVRPVTTLRLFARVTVPPLTASPGNVFCARSVVIVPVAENVYVLVVPAFHVEPAPEVFHEPAMVHAPVPTLRVPEVPPVMFTDETLTAELFAVRIPELPMTRDPPVSPLFWLPDVFNVVVFAPLPWTVRVPPHFSGLVAMVKAVVFAPLLNVTFVNSVIPVPAKVMVWETVELKVIEAAKLQDAEVDVFVQAPEAVQVPPPAEVM